MLESFLCLAVFVLGTGMPHPFQKKLRPVSWYCMLVGQCLVRMFTAEWQAECAGVQLRLHTRGRLSLLRKGVICLKSEFTPFLTGKSLTFCYLNVSWHGRYRQREKNLVYKMVSWKIIKEKLAFFFLKKVKNDLKSSMLMTIMDVYLCQSMICIA